MRLHLDLIAGLPYERYARFQESLNDLYALRPNELQLGFLKVLKGTPMEEKAAAYGIQYGEKPPYEVISTNWISGEELTKLRAVEEMPELYGNSMQFEYVLSFAVPLFDGPFAFFSALSDFYKGRRFPRI